MYVCIRVMTKPSAVTDRYPTDPHVEAQHNARQVAVPQATRSLTTLSHIDYEDAFLVETGAARDRTAEQWARAILEDAPVTMQSKLTWGWRALGLKLGSTGSDQCVLGWELRRRTPDHVLLGARSRVGMPAELVLERRRRTLLLATFVHQGNPVVRAVWAGVQLAHRRVVPVILERPTRLPNAGLQDS